MVSPSGSSVVLVRFPFSNLSLLKLRPTVVLASAGRDDWILCQVTSNPYADPIAVQITDSDFETGSLQRVSFARQSKLFTSGLFLTFCRDWISKRATNPLILTLTENRAPFSSRKSKRAPLKKVLLVLTAILHICLGGL